MERTAAFMDYLGHFFTKNTSKYPFSVLSNYRHIKSEAEALLFFLYEDLFL